MKIFLYAFLAALLALIVGAYLIAATTPAVPQVTTTHPLDPAAAFAAGTMPATGGPTAETPAVLPSPPTSSDPATEGSPAP